MVRALAGRLTGQGGVPPSRLGKCAMARFRAVRKGVAEPGVRLILALLVACLAGCGESANDNGTTGVDSEPASASGQLGPADYQEFRPGRSKSEILAAVRYRGNFQMATEYDGKEVAAISYEPFGGIYRDGGCEVWAIFTDDKFEKFVHPPSWDPKADGKRIEIGDFTWLVRPGESETVSIAD